MLKDNAPKAYAIAVRKSRRLRKEMTLPEVMLWKQLRQRPNGLKFRRQHPSGPYILDFYCNDARFAVEVDGMAHDLGDRPDLDVARDNWFHENNIETLRIAAADILKDVERVADAVFRAAVARLPLHHPAAQGGPPPRDKLGEEF